jgi:DNA-binding PadR family transcriptional regulator
MRMIWSVTGWRWERGGVGKGGFHQHLKGLQEAGLVTSAWDFPTAGPARLVYTITEAGMAYVQRVGKPQ